ncbi:hypothetical protein DIE21_33825 [Burkholderia sp. Bp9140]|nr:hypothetical protein DIE21_33825 [Burkholderia sp. Bp9140]
MGSAGRSLRTMVRDWLAPAVESGVSVSHVGRSVFGRYVCVVADNGAGPKEMLFFRHRDGKWYVFPPDPERPFMRFPELY